MYNAEIILQHTKQNSNNIAPQQPFDCKIGSKIQENFSYRDIGCPHTFQNANHVHPFENQHQQTRNHVDILYAFLVLGLVDMLYNVVNLAILSAAGRTDAVPLGVEPILFGLFYMGVDAGLIALKGLLRAVVSDAREKAGKPAPPRDGK